MDKKMDYSQALKKASAMASVSSVKPFRDMARESSEKTSSFRKSVQEAQKKVSALAEKNRLKIDEARKLPDYRNEPKVFTPKKQFIEYDFRKGNPLAGKMPPQGGGSEKKINEKVGAKISTIMHEGVRKNTQAPVSKTNPRRKVDIKQAIAIAESMVRRGKK